MGHQYPFLLTFYFVLNILCLQIVRSDENIGPADITVDRVEECDLPLQYAVPFGLKMNRVNRTHAGFTGCMDLGGPMDGSIALQMTAAKWGDGGWKPNALNYGNALCESLVKNVREPWETFLRGAGAESFDCPLPEGNYCVKDLVVDMNGLFPSMLYGNFKVDFEILKGQEKYRCIRMYVKSEPAKSS